MRLALLTEGGFPHPSVAVSAWCDRLVNGLAGQDFEVYELAHTGHAPRQLPPQVGAVHRLPLYGPPPQSNGRIPRRRFLECYRELATVLASRTNCLLDGSVDQADRFAESLYGLADLARECGGLPAALRSEAAIRVLEAACRAPGVDPLVGGARVGDLLTVSELLERALRPLSAPWFDGEAAGGAGGLTSADVCHATCGGPAVLPGLLVKHWRGTPLLVTEYGVRLREHYLGETGVAGEDLSGLPVQVQALLAAFHRLLAGEIYRQATVITAGNAHIRRWQERCGAPRTKITTVHPAMDARPFAAVGQAAEAGTLDVDGLTLVWVGRAEAAKDLVGLLHAFVEIHKQEPAARLRIISGGSTSRADDEGSPQYLAYCRALAAQLFPDEAADAVSVGESPVSFEEVGSPYVPQLADAYASGAVVVLSSVAEDFPLALVEAMFCGRATVSTDVGAVREVIGGTGLVVPPRNPRALAKACVELLRDPERRARLGAAARARALELFTVEENLRAFREIYLDLAAHREPAGACHDAAPFARPAEAHLPATWRSAAARSCRGPAGAGSRERTWCA